MTTFDLVSGLGAPLENAYTALIENLGHALGLHASAFDAHTRRVTVMTVQFAQRVGVPAEQMLHLLRGAALHDIGKIIVPVEILLKPGILTEDEWKLVRRHPEVGGQILDIVDGLRPAAEIPYCHHERWDGKGYPRGLMGEDIPLAARLFTLVDVWDALNNDQPYRKAWPRDKAVTYLRDHTRIIFDPALLEIFLEMIAA